jgi:hypothetical protein
MADFKTHITTSTLLGVGYAGAAYGFFEVPLSTCLLSGGLCSVSGMLPDIDSDSGVPLRESLAFAAAVVPMMLVDRLQQFGLSTETIVLAGAAMYLTIRFGLGEILRRYTVHRGMFHSIPAAVIFAEVAFLLASGTLELRCFKAGAVGLGYLTHLMLDELYSLSFRRGRLRIKRSLGTGLKIYSQKIWPNITTYAKLILLTYVVLNEPGWMQQFRQHDVPLQAGQAAPPAAAADPSARMGPQGAFDSHSPLPAAETVDAFLSHRYGDLTDPETDRQAATPKTAGTRSPDWR